METKTFFERAQTLAIIKNLGKKSEQTAFVMKRVLYGSLSSFWYYITMDFSCKCPDWLLAKGKIVIVNGN